jgi:glycosyltransferase involved in cell wall biosynthesis
MPKVSIVLPSYNYARYMDERIQSLLNQTYGDFELIIVDDASTDNSIEVIKKYEENPKVKTKFFSQNSGLPYKRWNDGAEMACGEYILFAGAGDACAPTMLEKLVEKLEANPNVGIAYCQSMQMDSESKLVRSMKKYTDTLDKQRWSKDYVDKGTNECRYLAIKNTIPNASAAMMRRQIFNELGGFDETLKLVADWMLWSKILTVADVAFVAEPLNHFRCHSGTVRSKMMKVGTHTEEIYNFIATVTKEAKVPQEYSEKAYERAAYRWVNSILRLLVTQPLLALEQAKIVHRIARQFDRKLNKRIFMRFLKDIATLGTFTMRSRLTWQ